ncbi:MAG: imelysin family protein [Bacteroidales bacterium]|nr:imelysin family protein [Bacteroidales bacterium]
MKKLTANIIAALCLVSCGSNNSDLSEKEALLQDVNTQFVSETVIPTYKGLADEAFLLVEDLEALEENMSDAKVVEACNHWKSARQYWEWSEAFLFGAASKYNIDPHIDTWPLDSVMLQTQLNDSVVMNNLDKYVESWNNGLVGFHGIEFILFRNGEERKAADITAYELKYAIAVANDLLLNVCKLEAAWAGIENIDARKAELLTENEMEPEDNFGEQMRLCGQPGSVWKSVSLGTDNIFEGILAIADEVANMKIGSPYSGQDINYIESPHSYNSIQDFYDNIISIRNVYYGGLGKQQADNKSLSSVVAKIDKDLDANVQQAIAEALDAIDAMPRPFVLNYTKPEVATAINAINHLFDIMTEAQTAVAEY